MELGWLATLIQSFMFRKLFVKSPKQLFSPLDFGSSGVKMTTGCYHQTYGKIGHRILHHPGSMTQGDFPLLELRNIRIIES